MAKCELLRGACASSIIIFIMPHRLVHACPSVCPRIRYSPSISADYRLLSTDARRRYRWMDGCRRGWPNIRVSYRPGTHSSAADGNQPSSDNRRNCHDVLFYLIVLDRRQRIFTGLNPPKSLVQTNYAVKRRERARVSSELWRYGSRAS